MDRRYRLTRWSDFKRVRRTGRSIAHPLAILIAASNGLSISRFGITAGRNLGNAAKRNRAKRRLREAARLHLPVMAPGWDVILIARGPILEAEWMVVLQAVQSLMRRSGLLLRQEEHDH